MKGAILVLTLLVSAGAFAQQASREQEQLRRLRAQATQLQQALSAAQQAQKVAEQERDQQGVALERLDAEAKAARGSAAAQRRRVDALEAELAAERRRADEMAKKLETVQEQLDVRRRELGEAREAIAGGGREIDRLRNDGERTASRLAQCEKDNVELYGLGREILDRYRDRTLGERLGQAEPLLQTGRVKLENLVDGYRDRMDEHRIVGESGNPAGVESH
ncbi:hypothetical protein [Methyloversatilis thermotolerans]|uniref:hypothetical protein n=1 Tax=Methyloversatilis thermotolerans TaxID=1346290 RepID=UPI00037D06EE|nr:hypothetical protein [Methyloversatilis thermotolerans]